MKTIQNIEIKQLETWVKQRANNPECFYLLGDKASSLPLLLFVRQSPRSTPIDNINTTILNITNHTEVGL